MPTGTWTTRYEDLRRRAQDGNGGGDGSWGLALFFRQGLRAWMRAWPAPVPSPTALPVPTLAMALGSPSSVPMLPAGLTQQLVPLLASMILARPSPLQEARP